MLNKTSTDYAPWFIVPANRKWYRNLVVGRIVVDAIERLDMQYPQSDQDVRHVVIP